MDRSEDHQTKRSARTERRRQQTAREILDAARRIVISEGSGTFSLGAVARELGLTKPAIYHYYKSKEALLMELVVQEWLVAGAEVEKAVDKTTDGAAAIEALMRTFFNRYRRRPDLFSIAWKMITTPDLSGLTDPDDLNRIRPVNNMLYGGAEARLLADQKQGRFAGTRNPRLFAFNAHMAVVGILNMKALSDAADDQLLHNDDDLLDDMCRTFREAARTKGDLP